MALPCECVVRALMLALVLLLHVDLSSGHSVVKGSVSCLDCTHLKDLTAGVRVAVKCGREKQVTAVALTDDKGAFEAELPLSSSSPADCVAVLLGGPMQLCSHEKSLVSHVIKDGGASNDSYALATPLAFFSSSCLKKMAGERSTTGVAKTPDVGSSKTIDLPLPPEWGLAPSSYYIPFIPIIGIP